MKTRICRNIRYLMLSGLVIPIQAGAQVAQWTFNNILTGTGSANVTAGNAVLSSDIPTGAYNGGTVYYGEDGWPSGALDPDAYLEFSVTPTAAHSLTVSSMLLNIRRSTTGSSGSGPNSWSLRSSLDGFTADISGGTLSTSSTPAIPVTFNASFANLSTPVIFRLYGYNETVSAGGGLNRFVFDNISISGSTILPVIFNSFVAKTDKNTVDLTWQLGGEGDIAAMNIERSGDGNIFDTIGHIGITELNTSTNFTYSDNPSSPSGSYYYRIGLVSPDGKISYSPVQQISFDQTTSFSLLGINSGTDEEIRFRITTCQSGTYQFGLYDMNGTKVSEKQTNLYPGTQILNMDYTNRKPGIYILTAACSGQRRVTRLMVQ